jgi:ribonuclease T2
MNKRTLLGAVAGLACLTILGAAGLVYSGQASEATGQPVAGADSRRNATALPFDFYVLALTWSPTWCSEQSRPDPQQCAGARAYSFAVHGLWPQFEQGYPRACDSLYEDPSDTVLDEAEALYPSPRLARIQWERHGTCSGLSPEDYFEDTRRATQAVIIPDDFLAPQDWQTLPASEIEAAFIAANPGLSASAIAVIARDSKVREVRVCLSNQLEFQTCREVDRSGAEGSTRLRLPPVRQARRP